MSAPTSAWGVMVWPHGSKQGWWLGGDRTLVKRRIYAAMAWGADAKERCERIAAQITEKYGERAEPRRF